MLRPSREELHLSELAQIVADFKEYGVAKISDIWDRESALEFRKKILDISKPKDSEGRWTINDENPYYVLPILHPVFRAVARSCLSESLHQAHAGLFEIVWKITDPDFQQPWHKDRQHDLKSGTHYSLPNCVHIGSYFEDTEVESGTTEFILGSHRNQNLGPVSGVPERLLPRAQDAIVFDQRTWHRAPKRNKSDRRVFAFGGFVPVELYGPPKQRKLPPSWLRQLHESDNDEEKVLLGGRWELESWQLK